MILVLVRGTKVATTTKTTRDQQKGRNWEFKGGGAGIYRIILYIALDQVSNVLRLCLEPYGLNQSVTFRRGRSPPTPPPVAPLSETF